MRVLACPAWVKSEGDGFPPVSYIWLSCPKVARETADTMLLHKLGERFRVDPWLRWLRWENDGRMISGIWDAYLRGKVRMQMCI